MRRTFRSGVVLALVVLLVACSPAKSPEQYELGEDSVPSITLATGEMHLRDTAHNFAPQQEERSYTYTRVDNPAEKIREYVIFLRSRDFYVLDEDIPFGQPEGSGTLGKPSKEQGKLFLIIFQYRGDTIELKVIKTEGTLEKKE